MVRDLKEDRERLLRFGPGDSPVILSVPHGGTTPVPGIEGRRGNPKIPGDWEYFTEIDVNTLRLGELVRERMAEHEVIPFTVITMAHRRDLDINRSWDHNLRGYEAAGVPEDAIRRAKHVFDGYHDTISEYIGDIRERFGPNLVENSFLIDLHGTHLASGAQIELGTLHGVSAKIELVYPVAYTVPTLWDAFAQAGFTLSGEPVPEGEDLEGCFVSAHHGRLNPGGLNAVLIEVDISLRQEDELPRTAARIGDVLAGSVRAAIARADVQ